MKPNKNLLIVLASSVILLSAWTYYMSQTNSVISDDQREFQKVTKQSSSDEPETIEDDLEDTDFEDLDTELPQIETELNSTSGAKTQ